MSSRRATAKDPLDPAEAVDPIGELLTLREPREPEPEPSSPWEVSPRRLGPAILVIVLAPVGFLIATALFGSFVAPLLRWLGSLPPGVLVGVATAAYLGRKYARWRAGIDPLSRAIKAHAPHIPIIETGRAAHRAGMQALTGVALPFDPNPEQRRAFDPMDPADRAMAYMLYACRVADGIALGNGLRIDRTQLRRDSTRARSTRIAEWTALWTWLNGLTDPRSAWLGSMALAEESLAARALAALDALDAPPWADDLRQTMLADGPFPSRLAAAVHWREVDALDALLAASANASLAQRIALVRARAQLDDPPFEEWLSEPVWGPVLVALDASCLEPTHWQRLVAQHPRPSVAAQAATRALSRESEHAVRAARTLLDRRDVWDAAQAWPDRELLGWLELMLIRLGTDGDADDLRRLGRWAAVERLRPIAQRELRTLRGSIRGLPDGGGLAVVATTGGDLSLVTSVGELSLADASEPAR